MASALRWFINEEGTVYCYNRTRQEADYPNDYRFVFQNEGDAQKVADIISSLHEMTDLAGWSLDRLTGQEAEDAERNIDEAKVLLKRIRPGGPDLVIPTEEMIGKVARVRLREDSDATYIAEVRKDFGKPAWAGSWHGFTLDKGKPVVVVEWLT